MPSDFLSDDDYDRLARIVSGEASDVERLATERWAAADPARAEALAELRSAWHASREDGEWNVDAAWNALSSRLASAPPGIDSGDELRIVPIASRRRWWQGAAGLARVAAVAVVVIGGALLSPRLRSTASSDSTTIASAPASHTTGTGERRSVTLSDGSLVVLAASSTLRTRDGFGGGSRDVELAGEAFFTVVHDEARPFRVFVGGTIVEDLGTEFAVRAYTDSSQVRVAVASGSVAVRRGTTADTAVVLAPRDVAMVRGTGEVNVTRGIDVLPFTAFATGRLIFRDTPFSEVILELERWYGITVTVSERPLLDRHLTTEFQGESVDEVLRIIGMTLNARYERNGSRVEFRTGEGVSGVRHAVPGAVVAETGA